MAYDWRMGGDRHVRETCVELSRGLWGLNVEGEFASVVRMGWCDQEAFGAVRNVMMVQRGDWCGVAAELAN